MDITATVILVLVGSGITLFSAITNLRYKIDEKRDMILGVYKEHQDLEKRFRKYILQKDIGEYAVHAVIIIGMHSFIWIAIAIYLLSLGVNTNDKMNCVMAMIIFVMALSGTVGCIYTALSARHDYKVWEEYIESGTWRGDTPTYRAVLGLKTRLFFLIFFSFFVFLLYQAWSLCR